MPPIVTRTMAALWAWAGARRDAMVTAALGPAPTAKRPAAARTAPLDPDLHALIRDLID